MGIRQILERELVRFAPRPTLRQAKQAFKVASIQNAAIEVAALIREEAIEINTRRLEIEKVPPLNWRSFLVGSTAVGIAPARGGGYNWFTSVAWNTKPHPNQDKFCAERRNGRRLVRQGCTCIVGIATVALCNIKGDDRSGLHGPGPTLDPCEVCRDDAHGEFREFYCDETLVVNENPETQARSGGRTWAEIFAHHGEVYWGNNPKVLKLHGGR